MKAFPQRCKAGEKTRRNNDTWWDSNPRPFDCKACSLPLCYNHGPNPSKQKSEHFKVDHYWALRIRDLLRTPSPPLGMSHRDRTVYIEIFGMSYVSSQRQ